MRLDFSPNLSIK